MTATLSSPSLLLCNKKKKGDNSCNKTKRRLCSKTKAKGDDNVVVVAFYITTKKNIAFFVALQQNKKKKATTTKPLSPFLVQQNENNAAKKKGRLLRCNKQKQRGSLPSNFRSGSRVGLTSSARSSNNRSSNDPCSWARFKRISSSFALALASSVSFHSHPSFKPWLLLPLQLQALVLLSL
jgi:hypothetical protein